MVVWLEYLTAQNHSAVSVSDYRERVLPFVTWCEERGLMYAPQVSQPQLKVISATCMATAKPTAIRWRSAVRRAG